MILGGFLLFLALIALLPVISVSLAQCTGVFPTKFHCFIVSHTEIILAVGVVVLISALAVLASYITKNSSERRDKYNREMQAELQIASFRQDWINNMHRDLSDLYERMISDGLDDRKDSDGLGKLVFAVQTRLNIEEDDLAKEVFDLLRAYMTAYSDKDPDAYIDAIGKLPNAVTKFLKAEWERLKKDLDGAKNKEI